MNNDLSSSDFNNQFVIQYFNLGVVFNPRIRHLIVNEIKNSALRYELAWTHTVDLKNQGVSIRDKSPFRYPIEKHLKNLFKGRTGFMVNSVEPPESLIGPVNGVWQETVTSFLLIMATAEHPDGTRVFNENNPLIGKTINVELPKKLTELQHY